VRVGFIILNISGHPPAIKCSTDLFVVIDLDCGRKSFIISRFSTEEDSLDLRVEYQDESTTGSSDDVGEGTLEESFGTFVCKNSLEAVHGTSVHLLLSARVHHESSSDGIERVRDDTGADGNDLGEGPHGENASLLGIREKHGLTGIEHTEVRSSVEDDTDN